MSSFTVSKWVNYETLSPFSAFLSVIVMSASIIYERIDFYNAIGLCFAIGIFFNNVPEIFHQSRSMRIAEKEARIEIYGKGVESEDEFRCKSCEWNINSNDPSCYNCGAQLN